MVVARDKGGNFNPCPAGSHQGVCVDVIDHGMVDVTFGGKIEKKHKATIRWQVEARDPERGNERYQVQQRYTVSLNRKANLRRDLIAWRGCDFNEDELAGFELDRLMGANCMLVVVHDEKEGTTWANIGGISPLPESMTKLVPENYVRQKDRDQTATAPAVEPQQQPSVPF